MPSNKELVGELNKHKAEISKLKNTLNEINDLKESWFKKKDELYSQIKKGIQQINSHRANRDILNKEVKELKAKRDDINKKIALKLKDLDDLKKEKAIFAKSLNIKESPSKIKQDIERLEFKIETEVMPFDKEQALMRKIKELKELYDDCSIIIEIDKKVKDASNLIRDMRKEADKLHRLLQEKATQSQGLHEEILRVSAEIDKIKLMEEEAFNKFSEFKKKFNDANAQLKEKLKVMNGIKNQLDKIDSERKEKKRLEEELILKSKEDEVNQKIKRRQKLTTEDLLVFQKFEGR